jgi:hypothetical protein
MKARAIANPIPFTVDAACPEPSRHANAQFNAISSQTPCGGVLGDVLRPLAGVRGAAPPRLGSDTHFSNSPEFGMSPNP